MSCKLGTDKCGVTCTSYSGGDVWRKMEHTCNEIPCSICSNHCKDTIQAVRDRIALAKGKKVYDMDNLKRECNNWKCTARSLGI